MNNIIGLVRNSKNTCQCEIQRIPCRGFILRDLRVPISYICVMESKKVYKKFKGFYFKIYIKQCFVVLD